MLEDILANSDMAANNARCGNLAICEREDSERFTTDQGMRRRDRCIVYDVSLDEHSSTGSHDGQVVSPPTLCLLQRRESEGARAKIVTMPLFQERNQRANASRGIKPEGVSLPSSVSCGDLEE
jgi:hypothetical protein